MHNGSFVLGCFLDASKAFDLVDHCKLFQKLKPRGLPSPILRFLSSLYSSQQLKVHWGSSFSDSFCVSRQSGVLSPVLFSVYLDGLLEELSDSGVGCYWGSMFTGAFPTRCIVILSVGRRYRHGYVCLRNLPTEDGSMTPPDCTKLSGDFLSNCERSTSNNLTSRSCIQWTYE